MACANNTPLVSVIVPVYNAENTVGRCIESILAQTYPHFQLILVNDGSKDASGAICDEYAAKDSRIIAIHIPNGGVSNARNTGLDAATGEYVFFVDSDDWILPEHIALLMPCGDEDWVCCGIRIYKNNIFDHLHSCSSGTVSRSQWMADFVGFWSMYSNNSPWRCSYKSSIIREHHLRFSTDLSISEDELFNLSYILHSNSLRYTENCTYCYETGADGSAMSKHHLCRTDSCIKTAQAAELLTRKAEYRIRWHKWRDAIAHHRKHLKTSQSAQKLLRSCYKDTYFRECIPYIRQNGSLDEKIETYFMTPLLHPLFPLFYKTITLPQRLKGK